MKNSLLRKLITGFLAVVVFHTYAGEGMWLPNKLKGAKESEMKNAGLKIDADLIYNEQKESIKDAVVHFGGGCTGEIISNKGLIVTNHHCGYDNIQKLSSVSNDLLRNGYWAKSQSDELPCKGLTVSIIQSMQDVTDIVLKEIYDTTSEKRREKIINDRIEELSKINSKGNISAFVKTFSNGLEFILYQSITFKDIRLVGAPPSSIGKFGEDSDNWMWPRHTGDFSLFRIYVDNNNNPAEYSKDNVPYQPKYVIPVSNKGVSENDFTFVYGFPGRTNEYLSSFAIEQIQNFDDPVKVNLRTKRLNTYESFMKNNDTIKLQYSSKHSSVSNAWKKWQGEMNGLKKADVVNKKRQEENLLSKTIASQNLIEYSGLFSNLQKAYNEYSEFNKVRIYYTEAFMAVEAFQLCDRISSFQKKLKGLNEEQYKKELELFSSYVERFHKDYALKVDAEMIKNLLPEFFNNVKRSNNSSLITSEMNDKQIKIDYNLIAEKTIKNSLLKKDSLLSWLKNSNVFLNKIEKNEVMLFYKMVSDYYNSEVKSLLNEKEQAINLLNRKLLKLKMNHGNKEYYPDANATLRLTFGKVSGYRPRNAIQYDYYTTAEGILEKKMMGNEDYILDETLKQKIISKDYNDYSYNTGELRTAFIASNHTTGGNSGSPVFNSMGQLIGINFDRNWEGTMSDLFYDENQTRNISLDVKYMLFVIDKIGNSKHLIEEINLVK